MTRSCARRSFAAETIFMAFVICCVFFTERMRRRMSIRLGMALSGRGGGRRCGAFGGAGETLLAFRDSSLHLGLQTIVEDLLFANRLKNRRMRVVNELVQLFFKGPALFHREIVEESAGSGKDDENLF